MTTKKNNPKHEAQAKTYTAERDAALLAIAREVLGFETLETRLSDQLDFHEVAVWDVLKALRHAYTAGHAKGVADAVQRIIASRRRPQNGAGDPVAPDDSGVTE